MTGKHEPRLFPDDLAIRHIGEGLLACSLRREEWTHEAHLAACCWLVVERPDIAPERDLADLIRRFNESVGGVNSDSEGYHETITQCFIRAVRLYLARPTRRGRWWRRSTGSSARRRAAATGPYASTTRRPCSPAKRGWAGWSRIWRRCRGRSSCGRGVPMSVVSRKAAKPQR